MKTLTAIVVFCFAIQANADVKILDFKDWTASQIDKHDVSEKGACVAMTKIKGKDSYLEVYAEKSSQGGYVQPMVQIVTTSVRPALGVVASIDGTNLPMTISLKETKEVVLPGIIPKKVEQQVFIGKFKDKESMIRLIRAKNRFVANYYDSTGRIAKETFSLRGSAKTVKTMMDRCL